MFCEGLKMVWFTWSNFKPNIGMTRGKKFYMKCLYYHDFTVK